uniref:Uncharacterized protein n=1 Tax=Triticum urartu TaxID=4572 RepID=A0A8R7QBG2_TRIUA
MPTCIRKPTDSQSLKAWSLSCSDDDNLGVRCKNCSSKCSTKCFPSTAWLATSGWPTGCSARSKPLRTGLPSRQTSRSMAAPWPGPTLPAPRTWPRGSCGAG